MAWYYSILPIRQLTPNQLNKVVRPISPDQSQSCDLCGVELTPENIGQSTADLTCCIDHLPDSN